jgi:branched-subunit amino acid ABC-type transport system permease component
MVMAFIRKTYAIAKRVFDAIVVVLGGMGNFWGAWVGALIIGEVNSFAVAYVPKWASLFNYLVMIVILIFKPEGLFGRKVRKKI